MTDSGNSHSNQLDAELLKILVCPVTRTPLRQEGDELVSQVGPLRYPVRDGIPILLADEAKLPDGIASLDEFKAKYKDQIPT
jgi:uncharacterized protein